MRQGHTLLELSAVLALVAAGASILLSAAQGSRDRWAVEAAREEVAGLIAEARTAALAWGGAVVRLSAPDAEASYSAGGVVRRKLALDEHGSVALVLPRGAAEVELAFDALGLGRVASRTLGFRRGSAEASLVVSAYGRVRRW